MLRITKFSSQCPTIKYSVKETALRFLATTPSDGEKTSKRIDEFRKKLRETTTVENKLRETTPIAKKLRETTPIDHLEELEEGKHPYQEKEPLKAFPNNTNPETGEIGGPRGPEPTRYGDWERKGRVSDF